MQYLPDPEEQEWLIKELSGLVQKCGPEKFFRGPIVEPTPTFFPDPRLSDHQSLDRLVRRLMQYAGLDDLDVLVGTLRNVDEIPIPHRTGSHHSVAGVFLGIQENQCVFCFDEEMFGDAEYMAGVMAHEVAHAFRTRHDLVVSDTNVEECLTDVTTSYLGFGILATQISHRYRAWHNSPSSHSWSTQKTGYLTPQAHAFLMATQLIVRDDPPDQCRHLLSYLEANQATFTRAALEELEVRRTEILQSFNHHSASKSPVKSLEQILKPLPEYSPPVDAEEKKNTTNFNAGRPVFKVARTWAPLGAGIGLVFGIILGITVAAKLDNYWLALPFCAFSGVVIGTILGRRHRLEICSEPECKTVLGSEPVCPGCGGSVAGSIRRVDDRLEAAETWEQQKKTKPH